MRVWCGLDRHHVPHRGAAAHRWQRVVSRGRPDPDTVCAGPVGEAPQRVSSSGTIFRRRVYLHPVLESPPPQRWFRRGLATTRASSRHQPIVKPQLMGRLTRAAIYLLHRSFGGGKNSCLHHHKPTPRSRVPATETYVESAEVWLQRSRKHAAHSRSLCPRCSPRQAQPNPAEHTPPRGPLGSGRTNRRLPFSMRRADTTSAQQQWRRTNRVWSSSFPQWPRPRRAAPSGRGGSPVWRAAPGCQNQPLRQRTAQQHRPPC